MRGKVSCLRKQHQWQGRGDEPPTFRSEVQRANWSLHHCAPTMRAAYMQYYSLVPLRSEAGIEGSRGAFLENPEKSFVKI